jgi:hypothetical protein
MRAHVSISVFFRAFLLSALVTLAVSPRADAYDKSAFVAPEGKALFVFIQNQQQDRKMEFTVFAGDKRCVARVRGREAEVLPVEPATYIYYVMTYNDARRIELFPEAGRTYFIRLHTVDKVMGPIPAVTLVRRASEEHMLLKHHLEGAHVTRARDDKECYGQPLQERKNRTQRRLNGANGDWKKADDAYRDRYRLIEKDGLTEEDIGRL